MTRTLRTAAAALAAAAVAAPASAFEAAGDRLPTFRGVEAEAAVATDLAAELLSRAEIFAPLALVAVAALYVSTESRFFGPR